MTVKDILFSLVPEDQLHCTDYFLFCETTSLQLHASKMYLYIYTEETSELVERKCFIPQLYIYNEETRELVEGKCFMPVTFWPQIHNSPETFMPSIILGHIQACLRYNRKKIQ